MSFEFAWASFVILHGMWLTPFIYTFPNSFLLDKKVKKLNENYIRYRLKHSKIFFRFCDRKTGIISKTALAFSVSSYITTFIYLAIAIPLSCIWTDWSYIARIVLASVYFLYWFILLLYLDVKYKLNKKDNTNESNLKN